MKALFAKYKGVVVFLVLFLGTYLVLSVAYALYLKFSNESSSASDFITSLVADQSSLLINSLGYTAEVLPHPEQPSMLLKINGNYLARIVEGCNAISIIVLFVSFVIAFAQKFKPTVLFLFAGVVLIYSINLVRIAILAIALYEYPQHEHFLHGVVFPSIIYGMVFLLWMLWVRWLTPKKSNL